MFKARLMKHMENEKGTMGCLWSLLFAIGCLTRLENTPRWGKYDVGKKDGLGNFILADSVNYYYGVI